MIKFIIIVFIFIISNFSIIDGNLWGEVGRGDFFVWNLNGENIIVERGRNYLFPNNQESIGDKKYSIGDNIELFRKLKLRDSTVWLPAFGGVGYSFAHADDGQLMYVGNEYGLYELNALTDDKRDLLTISKEERHTYINKSLKLHNENYFSLIGGILGINPLQTNLIYSSNKNHLETLNHALYLFDLETLEERLLYASNDSRIYGCYWLNNDELLLHKNNGEQWTLSIINLNGNEMIIRSGNEDIHIDLVNSEYIIYTEWSNTNEIKVLSATTYQEIIDVEPPNDVIFRGGTHYNGKDKWGYLYTVDDGITRYIQILNLDTGVIENIDCLPKSENSVLDFWFIDDNTMLIVTLDLKDSNTIKEGWIVKLNEND